MLDLSPAFAQALAWREGWGVEVGGEVQVGQAEVRARVEEELVAELLRCGVEALFGIDLEALASCQKAEEACQVERASVVLQVLVEEQEVVSWM